MAKCPRGGAREAPSLDRVNFAHEEKSEILTLIINFYIFSDCALVFNSDFAYIYLIVRKTDQKKFRNRCFSPDSYVLKIEKNPLSKMTFFFFIMKNETED